MNHSAPKLDKLRAYVLAVTSSPDEALRVLALVSATFALDVAKDDAQGAGDVLDSVLRAAADDVRAGRIRLMRQPTHLPTVSTATH